LPAHISDIFDGNRENDVALLTGWNQDEGMLFGPPLGAQGYRDRIGEQYGKDSATVLRYYPAASDEEAALSQLYLSRDQIFAMPNYIWAMKQAGKGRKVYVYRFSRKVPATGEYAKYGAFHTGEVPYAYNNLRFGDRPYEPADQELATMMTSYWVNFIRSGDPNGKGLPAWPQFNADKKQHMVLDLKSGAAPVKEAEAFTWLYGKMKK
jgi:para-nitrobenzyl esterase